MDDVRIIDLRSVLNSSQIINWSTPTDMLSWRCLFVWNRSWFPLK